MSIENQNHQPKEPPEEPYEPPVVKVLGTLYRPEPGDKTWSVPPDTRFYPSGEVRPTGTEDQPPIAEDLSTDPGTDTPDRRP